MPPRFLPHSWCNPKCAALFQNSDTPPGRQFQNGMPSAADRLWPCPAARAAAELSGGTSNVTDNSRSSLSTSSRTYVLLFHRMLTFVTAFLASARTEKNDEPLVWAMRKAAGFCGSIVTCAASIAEIGPGKLIVVTRKPETGIV